MSHARIVFWGLSMQVLSCAGVAHANGAFPDSLSILVPPERPSEITVATNFGLISSQDGGTKWTWACETPLVSMGALYQVGPGAAARLFSLSTAGLVFSDDAACAWTAASGDAIADKSLMDAFPDPGDAGHVLAIALTRNEGAGRFVALESRDGGVTFARTIYTSPADVTLTGVEVARSDPRTIYLTGLTLPALTPRVTRSNDGGATWQVQDLGATLGTVNQVRLIAVDSTDPNQVFLRVGRGTGEALAVLNASTGVVTEPVSIPGGVLSSFVRMESGTIIAAGIAAGATGVAFRSQNGGATFTPLGNPRRFRALAERKGRLFAAADNWRDDFALGVSEDEGTTWRSLMHYADVSATKPCVEESCRSICRQQVALGLWSASVCGDTATIRVPDPMRPEPGGVPDAVEPTKSAGGCQVLPGRRPPVSWLVQAFLVLAAAGRRGTPRSGRAQVVTPPHRVVRSRCLHPGQQQGRRIPSSSSS